jgi:CubicO group peptidase (beta-lactamase class C family)
MTVRFTSIWTIVVSLTTLIACTTSKQLVKTKNKDFQEIDLYLQSLIDTGGIPGIAIAITSKKDIIYSKAFGVKNVQTKEKLQLWNTFHIASISKTFAATAIMQLFEQGKIDINKPLVTYLPYFRLNDERFKVITIKQMLNHTSGMPDVQDYEWEKAVTDDSAAEMYVRILANEKMISEPGIEYHYSNIAYDVFAEVIAKVSGMSFETYVKKNILIPLEMYESSFYLPDIKQSLRTSPHIGKPARVSGVYPYNRMHAPSSTLNTNVLELSHWAIANMNEGKYKAARILSAATHSMMMTPTFTTSKERKRSIGLSWFMYPYRGMMNYEHGGRDLGYKSMLTLSPEKEIGIIILCNIEAIHMDNTRNKVMDILLAKYDKTSAQ